MKPIAQNKFQTYVLIFCINITPLLFASELPNLGESSLNAIDAKTSLKINVKFKEFMSQQPLLHDYYVETGVKEIVQKIDPCLISNCEKREIYIIQDPEINALAGPNGIIAVNSGLILATRNSAELASVLAHEITHLKQNHLTRNAEQGKQLIIPMAVAALGAIALGTVNGQLGSAGLMTTMAGSQQAFLNYSRQMENEADLIGLQMLSTAGYDLNASADFLEKLQYQDHLNEYSESSQYLRTHPLTSNRIAELRQRTLLLHKQKPARNDLDYLLLRERVRVATYTHDALNQYYQNVSVKNTHEKVALEYGKTLSALHDKDLIHAEGHYFNFSTLKYTSPILLGLAADIAIAKGQSGLASELFNIGLEKFPNHYGLLMSYLELLFEGKQYDKARLVQEKNKTYMTDDYVLLSSQINAHSGHLTQAYLSRAEVLLNKGQYKQAKAMLKAAIAQPNLDEQLKQQLQAKLDELKHSS